jgi:hypothetical protein
VPYAGGKTANRKTFNAISKEGSVTMDIPTDAKIKNKNGKFISATGLGKSKEVSPIAIEWRDGKLDFIFKTEGVEGLLEDELLFIPASQYGFSSFASGLFLNSDEEKSELISYIKDVAKSDPKVLEKGFWKALGVTDEQFEKLGSFTTAPPKAGSNAGTPKSSSSSASVPSSDIQKMSGMKYGDFNNASNKAWVDETAKKIRSMSNLDDLWKQTGKSGTPNGQSNAELLAGFVESGKTSLLTGTPGGANTPSFQ